MPGRVVPKHEDRGHAIAMATFAAEWAQPLGEDEFKAILDRHEAIAPDLPRKQAVRGMTINLAPAQSQASAAQAGISGLVFDRLQPNGDPAWMIVVNPTHVGVTCGGSEYSRWTNASARAGQYLSAVLEMITPARPITIIALQYLDEFIWRGDNRDDFVAERLFQRSTRHLVPRVFDTVGLWHSHAGFYNHGRTPVPHRTLNNVNVQILDTDVQRVAQIVMAHRVIVETPIADRPAAMFSRDGLFTSLLRMVHDLDKSVLRDLLIPQMAEQIGLNREAAA